MNLGMTPVFAQASTVEAGQTDIDTIFVILAVQKTQFGRGSGSVIQRATSLIVETLRAFLTVNCVYNPWWGEKLDAT